MSHDLLDFPWARHGAKLVIATQRCDLESVCHNIAEEARSGHPDREISVVSTGDCVGVWDCERMAQLVSNLVGNAIQHGLSNTPVTLTITGTDARSVTLVVRNQGAAIPPDRRSSIFDPLQRGAELTERNERGSLGLGLYIAKDIAQAHGGSIRLLESDALGTAFVVLLPRTAVVR